MDGLSTRISNFQANCTCATEQHFSLRWDELNRLVEGRRFDRVGGSVGSGTGAWTYAARMRYRYDGANQRTVKESFEASGINTASRVALFIYPGDFERRGLVRNTTTYDAVTTGVDATETQYMVAGARIVWDPATSAISPNFDRNRRITYALTDLLQTSSGVIDLVSGELLELSTYYPNGARENLWASDSNAPLEPMGFTGKEADEEIGLTYFGERWLMPRLGRWASPDPLHVHASGGGEALNSYHYVSGNLLQARDPLGLYGDVGHYYVTLIAAMSTGSSPEEARAIAFATELPDEVATFDAKELALDLVATVALAGLGPIDPLRIDAKQKYMNMVHVGLHALSGGRSVVVREVAERMALAADSIGRLGASLHMLGDAYSHTVPPASDGWYGHASRTEIPASDQQQFAPGVGHAIADGAGGFMHIDDVAFDPMQFVQYAAHAWSVLNERGGNRGTEEDFNRFMGQVLQIALQEDESEQRAIAQQIIGSEALGDYRPEDHGVGSIAAACQAAGGCSTAPAELQTEYREQAMENQEAVAAGTP